MLEFYKGLSLITIFCGALLLGGDLSGITHIGLIGWLALAFFVVLTITITNMTLQAGEKSPSRFITSIMGSVGIRMLVCVMFVLIYWVVVKNRDKFFIIYFFTLYLFFTVFEIMYLVSKLRTDKKNGLESKTN